MGHGRWLGVVGGALVFAACPAAAPPPPQPITVDAGAPDSGMPVDAGLGPWLDGGPAEVVLTFHQAAAPAGHLISNGQIFGGTIWYPFGPADIVGPTLVASPHRLGGLRYSLQPFLQTPSLTRSQWVAQLPGALASNPDLPFVQSWHQRGGTVIMNFMGTPQWLAGPLTPNTQCDNSFYWRMPADLNAWKQDVVTPITTFMRDHVGAGLRYDFWNEPTSCTWLGTTEDFLQFYAATAEAIRAVDPTAKVGGPSHADSVMSFGTMNDPVKAPPPFVQRFIEFSAAHAGGRLPLDFISLHSYWTNPNPNAGFHEEQTALVRSWLADAGYDPQATELINDEWNYEAYHALAVPDGGAPNLNLEFIDAVYSAQTMLAFDSAGYATQAGQALEDSGDDVASQTFAYGHPVPRPGYQVFELLSTLEGAKQLVDVEHPWVRAVAFRSGNVLRIFTASVPPRDDWSIGLAGRAIVRADPTIIATLSAHPQLAVTLQAWFTGTDPVLPAALTAGLTVSQQQAVLAGKTVYEAERARISAWGLDNADPARALTSPGRPITWRLQLDGVSALPSAVSHSVIDSKHSFGSAAVQRVRLSLADSARQSACASMGRLRTQFPGLSCTAVEHFCTTGDSSQLGVPPVTSAMKTCTEFELFTAEFTAKLEFWRTEDLLRQYGASQALIDAFRAEHAQDRSEYRAAWEAKLASPELAVFKEPLNAGVLPDGGIALELTAEPWSVQLFELTLAP